MAYGVAAVYLGRLWLGICLEYNDVQSVTLVVVLPVEAEMRAFHDSEEINLRTVFTSQVQASGTLCFGQGLLIHDPAPYAVFPGPHSSSSSQHP